MKMEQNIDPIDCADSSERGVEVHDDSTDVESERSDSVNEESSQEAFKKPALIIGPRRGKAGSLRALSSVATDAPAESASHSEEEKAGGEEVEVEPEKKPSEEKAPLPLPYREPSWGGIPTAEYKFEVLKSGVILSVLNLTKKSFHVIGRLPVCDIALQHPTISRYHAILQYRVTGDDKNGAGFYLYDLESTHGTFWNNCRIRPKTYVKLKGGHIIKFGGSQRKFILHTPPNDAEEESQYSVTELKEMRRLELLEREKLELERKEELEELERLRKEKEANDGIDWGMGEDADEETDLAENPYAQTNNEELFLDDPKKTLRGWFEREGYDLQYETEEKGIGQFLCWVDLPIDNARTVRAEALVKGKKKESVIQCALEACRILDRHGLLRQATHEGRKRKSRNWEEEDFYDSDEDNFLDRTGTVERKREQRMRNAGKLDEKIETYTSLTEKHSEVINKIIKIEKTLENHRKAKSAQEDESGEDALDAFMSHLSTSLLNKSDIIAMKSDLAKLRKEEESLKKLMDITKPANLPSLKKNAQEEGEVKREGDRSTKILRVEEPLREEDIQSGSGYGLIKPGESQLGVEEEKSEGDEKVAVKESSMEGEEDNNDEDDESKEDKKEASLKQKKRNQRRLQQRAEKAAKEIEKGYQEDVYKEDYSMWVPPEDQSGDGKTSLNDKYGY